MSDSTRREFLRIGGSVAGLGWVASQWPMLLALGQAACDARDRDAPLTNIGARDAADLAAIAAQIVPTDQTPGATEAGVIHFIDAALGAFMSGARGALLDGLAGLNASLAGQHPGRRFAQLDPDRQHAVLEAHQQSRLFSTMHFLTVAGMFAMPAHGGNRDRLGWALLGFDHRHAWEPPFGHYDTGEHGDD